ncbi:efflux RND transporter periplasmic adaptor subunit [Methylonatrum kenyense]|uniref:efflux RND transporter periplasmic adaptor subunit n=1 Tax=Methylonatrum kenyense TaxID=455253 RepID=UPI0020BEC021|nr:efflux RND transporter periplasmic adaptor subunit [Methylonatrum kenyense]MCK8516830.1 efflux RND transporter periplasmic adaptor subunit [Methylonatrum kenyense]
MSRLRLALLPCLASLLVACGDNGDSSSEENQPGADAVLITTETARTETVEILERTIGRITSRTTPNIASEVSGQITDVHVDAGDRVERGELLLEIDPEPYQLARASAATEIRRLEVSIRNQERELVRNRELLEDGFVTQSTVDGLESELEASREQLQAAQVQLDSAERDLRKTRIEAPVDAEVDERNVSDGDYVAVGEALFRLLSQDLLQVRLPYPETASQRLETGQIARMRAPLSGDQEVGGTIRELRPGLMGGSRTVEAIVNIENPGGWREGGSVNADVVVISRDGVVVPTAAIVQRPAGEVVYVIEDNKAHAREVEVGRRGRDRTEILDGVDDGDAVAVDGAGFLSDGAKVRIADDDDEVDEADDADATR